MFAGWCCHRSTTEHVIYIAPPDHRLQRCASRSCCSSFPGRSLHMRSREGPNARTVNLNVVVPVELKLVSGEE